MVPSQRAPELYNDANSPSSYDFSSFTELELHDLLDWPPEFSEISGGFTIQRPPSRARNAMGTSLFESQILSKRGITIVHSVKHIKSGTVWKHFRTSRPLPSTAEEKDAYRSIPGLENINIWVSTHRDFLEMVEIEWASLLEYELNDSEHEVRAYDMLLKREPRKPGISKTNKFSTERMIKFNMEPIPEEPWKAPPILPEEDKAEPVELLCDIMPDCAYWVSVETFGREFENQMSKIRDYVYVAQHRILCTYFSIEHKPNGEDALKEKHQIATAAAIVLYNRYELRKCGLEKSGELWTERNTSVLRHYGLIITRNEYSFWVIRARIAKDGVWQGCQMERLVRGCLARGGYLDMQDQIKIFAQWLNEVHRWGLTVHAPAVYEDIRVCVGTQHPLPK